MSYIEKCVLLTGGLEVSFSIYTFNLKLFQNVILNEFQETKICLYTGHLNMVDL